MPSGRGMQLTGQMGEYLVAAELCRRNWIAATFTGNVPHYDIIAADRDGNFYAIQVKTIKTGSWQFNDARQFIEINLDGRKQLLGSKLAEPYPSLVYVFVMLGSRYGEDRFFVLKWSTLQDIVVDGYQRNLEEHDYERPRRYDSFHHAIGTLDLVEHEGNWSLIDDTYNRNLKSISE